MLDASSAAGLNIGAWAGDLGYELMRITPNMQQAALDWLGGGGTIGLPVVILIDLTTMETLVHECGNGYSGWSNCIAPYL